MTTKQYDITEMVPASSIVRQAIMDTYGVYVDEEARFMAWLTRWVKKATRQSLASGKRYTLLNVNKNLRTAVLPCDFKKELFVGFINSCGEKVELNNNPNIVNTALIEDVPCENECAANCGCFPKQLCEDLTTTQVINKIRINDTDYDETVTSTLLPNGEYKVVTTTPYLDMVNSGVLYKDRIDYVTNFDVADCGCIEKTERNICKLENICFDLFCCFCSCCNTTNSDFGGYKIFPDNNVIKFDAAMAFDKVYMEYQGFLPKRGNEYLIPEVAFEAAINFIKFKAIENKRGVAISDRQWHWDRYIIERDNMNKETYRLSLSDILHAALTVPTFDYNIRDCAAPSAISSSSVTQAAAASSSSAAIATPPASLPSFGCNPAIITTNGQEMEGGITYHSPQGELIGVPIRIFARAFNRMMLADEYIRNADGGFTVLTGVYELTDEFDIFPKWCDANVTDIPDTVTMGMRRKSIKVDGISGSPVAGSFTYQHADLIGADVQGILVNKALETVIDSDFTFDPVTGTITRIQVWQTNDTGIIDYSK